MPVTRDIAATYRGPRKVMQRLLDMGQREDRALIFVMAACVITFIAQWPYLARRAHLEDVELNGLLAGSLMAWIIVAPLLLYVLAWFSHVLARLVGGKGSYYSARIALFWAFLATSPLMLLHGLMRGFIGTGTQEQIIGLVWLGCFLWFWLAGLWQAERA
ncbi:YIP1 family protein [Sulfitobacter sp. JL08]|jgi:Kef-type K+ transport system membrane component KefB|uniref:YIP1 family protein n=1 Tax=Sulfitobacter sp. JL08 TaxID=2070369 RepID=UPI000E0B29F1|nr:YIP1 family protein [Sulfitobacter sp. JL08]AXI56939.1 YIP1 family protein [Sulfitobacter sp. JL08]